MDPDLSEALHQVDLTLFGKRIRELRLSLGLTQAAVAGPDVTIGYVSRIEAGQRRPDQRLVELFAERLQSTPDYLITGIPSQLVDDVRLGLQYVELALETGEAVDAGSSLVSVRDKLSDSRLPEHWGFEADYLSARVHEVLGDYSTAIEEFERVAFVEPPHPRTPAALIGLSRCLREDGQLVRSSETAERGLRSLKSRGLSGTDEAIQLSVTSAAAYYERGDAAYAIHLCREAVSAADALGSPMARVAAYWNASIMESEGGDVGAAIQLANRALAILGEQQDGRRLALLRAELGMMLSRLTPPDVDEALRTLKQARQELVGTSASPTEVARCDAATARAYSLDGQLEEARGLAQGVLDRTEDVAVTTQATAHCVLGQTEAASGDRESAKRHFRAAVALLTGIGADRGAAETWLELGTLFEAVGDLAGASNAYRSAAAATGLSLPHGIAAALTSA